MKKIFKFREEMKYFVVGIDIFLSGFLLFVINDGAPTYIILFVLFSDLYFAILGIYFYRIGIYIKDDVYYYCNGFKYHELKWDEVKGAVITEAAPNTLNLGVLIYLDILRKTKYKMSMYVIILLKKAYGGQKVAEYSSLTAFRMSYKEDIITVVDYSPELIELIQSKVTD